jgi:hypothetical protein
MLPLIEIPESDTVPVWMYVVNGVELLINIFTIFVGIIVTRVVMRHKLFHSNLRLLMHIMGIGWFLLVGSRAASLVQQFIQPQAACKFTGVFDEIIMLIFSRYLHSNN